MVYLRRCFVHRMRGISRAYRELCLPLELLFTPSRDGGAREAQGQ